MPAKKAISKTSRKTATKKSAAKKAAAKKPVAKKVVTKKAAAKKPVAKKVMTKKAAAKKPVAKKVVAKKAAAKKPVAKKVVAKKAAAKKPVAKKVVAKKAAAKKKEKKKEKKAPVERHSAKGFRVNEYVAYPAHGVGQIIEISSQEIDDMSLDFFVINFEKEKMVLRVPVARAADANMRKLADKTMMSGAMKTLRGRARIKRTMWSRRAQDYIAKINSGDLIAIAEVVRDLYRNETQPEQSYSERQLYEQALNRLSREVAAVDKTDGLTAIGSLEAILAKATTKVVPKETPEENA